MNTFTLFSVFDALSVDRLYGWLSFGVSAVVVLAVLIVVHELGHFLTARLVGVRVEKFSIGFGRKVYGWRRGETEYMLSWVPLGGYVKFYGDDPDVDVEDEKDSFLNQEVWKRLLIVAAGPVSNILLAIVIASAAAMIGLPEGSRIIDTVKENSPAMEAGLTPGDRIEAINGVPMESWGQVRETIQGLPGKDVEIEVLRESGERVSLTIVPEVRKEKTIDGKEITIGLIGVTPRQVIKSYPPGEAIIKGAVWTWNISALTVWSIAKMVSRDIPADQIAGPIGIMKIAGEAAELGFVNLLIFIAIISVNLGILNLLPIPILDGGHIFFFSAEALLGRPIKMKTQEIAQQIGLFLLISLMVFAFYNDIMRLVKG